MWLNCGPGWCSRYSNLLRAGRCRDWIPVEAISPAPHQTGPGVHSASCTMGTWWFPRCKAAKAWQWPPTPSSAKVQERVELNFYPLLAFMASTKVNFTFYVVEYTNTITKSGNQNHNWNKLALWTRLLSHSVFRKFVSFYGERKFMSFSKHSKLHCTLTWLTIQNTPLHSTYIILDKMYTIYFNKLPINPPFPLMTKLNSQVKYHLLSQKPTN